MPWAPELFSAPALQRVLEQRRRAELVSVPFFDGLLAGELDALVESFVDEPELHDPMRGRVRGLQEFAAYVSEMNRWLEQSNAVIEDVSREISDTRGFEEVVVHLDTAGGRVDLPVAIVTDHPAGKQITELRVYYSSWRLTGRHINRPPVLQADPALALPDVVSDYQHAVDAGDVEAVVSAFEDDGYAREPAGRLHEEVSGLRTFYEQMFSNGGGLRLECCTVTDVYPATAVEYNVVRWGATDLPPQAGVAVYSRGRSGKLAAARIYDDVDPPIPS